MDLSDRKKKILAAIIEDYVETAEPVGSKSIAQNSGLGLSSATIRNEMSELETLGLLEQPHTSAGRVPSPKGYRIYVNEIMRRYRLTIDEAETINRQLTQRMAELGSLIADVGRVASRLTNYPAWVLASPSAVTVSRFDFICVDANTIIIVAMLSNNSVKNKLVHLIVAVGPEIMVRLSAVFNSHFVGIPKDAITIGLISSAERAVGDEAGLVSVAASFAIEILSEAGGGEAYITGASNLLRHPEFRDPDKALRLINYLSDEDALTRLPAPDNWGGVKMLIGPENVAEELRDSSVIIASYNIGENMQGMVGVVGPTRMDYSRIAARLRYLARGLGRIWGGQTTDDDNEAQFKGEDIDDERQ